MSKDFAKAIFIVFYAAKSKFEKASKDGKVAVAKPQQISTGNYEPTQTESPRKPKKPKMEEQKPTRSSNRLKRKAVWSHEVDWVAPTFVSGYKEDGTCIYSPIRVASRAEVNDYELMKEEELYREFTAQDSAHTLV
jgi:hypothetical protein